MCMTIQYSKTPNIAQPWWLSWNTTMTNIFCIRRKYEKQTVIYKKTKQSPKIIILPGLVYKLKKQDNSLNKIPLYFAC